MSAINIQDFMGIQNIAGNNTVYGDIKKMKVLENLKNTEILGNVLHRKTIQVEDTFEFEYTIFPKVYKSDPTKTIATELVVEKLTMVFGDNNWLEAGYKIDVRTKRSAISWGRYIATREANTHIAKSDQDNLIAVEMLYNYGIATGRYKLLPDLDTPGTAKEKITDAVADTATICETIVRTKTEVNAGINTERLHLVFSGYVSIELVKAANYMNASDKSFDVFKGGFLSRIYGKGYETSIYLDAIDKVGSSMNSVKNYDFSGLLGIVYAIDNFDVYTKNWVEIGINGQQQDMTNKFFLSYEKTWKTMGLIKPSREHLQYLFLRTAPTLAQINIARKWLYSVQPTAYKNFNTDMTADEYTNVNLNALNMRYAGDPVGTPPAKIVGVKAKSTEDAYNEKLAHLDELIAKNEKLTQDMNNKMLNLDKIIIEKEKK